MSSWRQTSGLLLPAEVSRWSNCRDLHLGTPDLLQQLPSEATGHQLSSARADPISNPGCSEHITGAKEKDAESPSPGAQPLPSASSKSPLLQLLLRPARADPEPSPRCSALQEPRTRPIGQSLIGFLTFLGPVGLRSMFPGGGGGGGGAEGPNWHFNMQLSTDKVVLSAAALLLATVAYRLYKSRPARASLQGGHSQAPTEEESEGLEQTATQGAASRTSAWNLRQRKASQGTTAPTDCSKEEPGGASPRVKKPERRDAEKQRNGQCPDPSLALPLCRAQEAGAAVGGKPELPHHPHLGSEPEHSPASLQAADSNDVDVAQGPGSDDSGPKQPGVGKQVSPQQPPLTPSEDSGDMNKDFAGSKQVSKEEPGACQASNPALHHQEGITNVSYSFSSVARIRVEENFLQEKAQGSQSRLKGKVYDYYVESTSQATSGLTFRTEALAEAPIPVPDPQSKEAAREGQVAAMGGGAPAATDSPRSMGRKDSLLQIVDNPELQLKLDGFEAPSPELPTQSGPSRPLQAPESSAASSSKGPCVQLVARTNFFHLPVPTGPAPEVHLDLGNCWEVLTLAKKQNLEALKEAAYKVMSDNYLQVLRSPDIYNRLSELERDLILQRRLQGQKCLVVAAVCAQDNSGHLCGYDDEQDVWNLLTQLPPEAVSQGCAICSLFNYLFVVSGCPRFSKQPSKRVFCYNPLTGIWSEVSPLNQARPHCRLVALDGCLYAIGGESLNSVECYDPRLDRWTLVTPLPSNTFTLAHTATAGAGELFVTGGSLRYLLLRFSVQDQRWQASPTAGSKDRTAEMVAVDGCLYRFDLNRGLGISVHRCSPSAGLWYECDTYRMPCPSAFQCAVVDHFIFCVGRQHTLCFLADRISPRFVPKELQRFPFPQGTLLPTVLTMPGPDIPHTRV